MNHIELKEKESFSVSTCHVRCNTLCQINVALLIIAACGFALIASGLISYTPSDLVYSGIAIFSISIISVLIANCCLISGNPKKIKEAPNDFVGSTKQTSLQMTAMNSQNRDTWESISTTFSRFFANMFHLESTPIDLFNMPLDIYLNVFRYLSGKELISASKVCRSWFQNTSDERFWQNICQKEMVFPTRNILAISPTHRTLYQNIKDLEYGITTGTPRISAETIPGSDKGDRYSINSLLKVNNIIFFDAMYFSQGCWPRYFEAWNLDLKICLFSQKVSRYLLSSKLELADSTVYLITWEISRNSSVSFSMEFYAFDLDTYQCSPPMYCDYASRCSHLQFEISDGKAFIGKKTGTLESGI